MRFMISSNIKQGAFDMPYISVRVAGGLSIEQKREIASGFSKILKDVAGKEPKTTYIVFDEVDKSNWAVGDMLLSDKK